MVYIVENSGLSRQLLTEELAWCKKTALNKLRQYKSESEGRTAGQLTCCHATLLAHWLLLRHTSVQVMAFCCCSPPIKRTCCCWDSRMAFLFLSHRTQTTQSKLFDADYKEIKTQNTHMPALKSIIKGNLAMTLRKRRFDVIKKITHRSIHGKRTETMCSQ